MEKFNYYDKIAKIYDQTRWLTPSIAEEVVDEIVVLVKATPVTTFLEPGVGTGLNVLPLVKRGYCVTGIDASQEMLAQFRQKLHSIPPNLKLIHADASRLPFSDNSFDVILTVHMLHTVSNWRKFLDEVERVLKPSGFYLNAQWLTPPARKEFEDYFRVILSEYEPLKHSKRVNQTLNNINVDKYLQSKKYRSNYLIAKEWTVTNTVEELLSFFKLRAYGLCWQVPEAIFYSALKDFEEFCCDHYGSLKTELSSTAKFEIWTYSTS
ncbi:Methyltransferase type 11 (plasmid) [Gloeothece citriformis PCC 7424]|uniref:Methyltransferase type 11 n=1 Tax=Gloeothece citriformis (strain PCC 7424) TaxID=65393 RepID=B7KLV4_GLOC7|nr:class I SAM-dependent methyltransferase [Gloeothece citriformis]ACK73776.1 Methyltransferase type 11 [Gloeothece citriformis PCC 7424]